MSLPFDWKLFGIDYAFSFCLAMLIGLTIPFVSIGRWFTALFRIPNDTYTHNIRYRLLATLIITVIYFALISTSLTVFNYFYLGQNDFGQVFLKSLTNVPVLFLIDFTASFCFDIPAYKAAHKIDDSF